MQVRWKNEVLWLGQLLPELLCLMLFRTLRGIWGDTRRACSSWTVLRRECRFPPSLQPLARKPRRLRPDQLVRLSSGGSQSPSPSPSFALSSLALLALPGVVCSETLNVVRAHRK